MGTFNLSRSAPLTGASKELLQAHFIEYQAIVTRISRFISLQFAVWPILVAFLTLAATGRHYHVLNQFQFVWVSVIAAQVQISLRGIR